MSQELINILASILISKIQNKEVNPKTNQPYSVADIKIAEVKAVVQAALTA